jgi:cellulose biosynthesis protein BcsQ
VRRLLELGRERRERPGSVEVHDLDIINRSDVLLIDTSSSLGLLTINALNAADYALIPVSCDFLSLVGLTLLFDTIRLLQDQLGSHVWILELVETRRPM